MIGTLAGVEQNGDVQWFLVFELIGTLAGVDLSWFAAGAPVVAKRSKAARVCAGAEIRQCLR